MQDAASQTPPTAGSWLHNNEFPTLGPEAISQGPGEEMPKGTKQLENAT